MNAPGNILGVHPVVAGEHVGRHSLLVEALHLGVEGFNGTGCTVGSEQTYHRGAAHRHELVHRNFAGERRETALAPGTRHVHMLVDQSRSQNGALKVDGLKARKPHIQIRPHRGHAAARHQNVNDAQWFRAPDLGVLNEVHS